MSKTRSSADTGHRPWLLRHLMVMALLLSGLTVGGSVIGAGVASAVTPGSPGSTQTPISVYTEDFSGQSAAAGALDITSYQGSAAAANSTYTADTAFTPAGAQCSGFVMQSTTPIPPVSVDPNCNLNDGWTQLQRLAKGLGLAQGQTDAQATNNQALTAYTNKPNGVVPAAEPLMLSTTNTITGQPGHFYAVSAWFAEQNCFAAHAKLTFSLLVNGVRTDLSSGLDPCGAYTGPFDQFTQLQSAALMLPAGGGTASLGLQLRNTQTSGSGNDVAFDLPEILDVTPQLDKAFEPATIVQGGTSTATFTITNTTDLAAKNGWSFTDNLPANVVATGVNSTTCSGTTVTAAANATGVSASGNLNQGQASCTVSVQVRSTVVGVYTNTGCAAADGTAIPGCVSNFSNIIGLYPPGPAVLTVTPRIDLSITKTANISSYTPGQPITYTVTVKNAASTAAVPVSTARDVLVTDPIPSAITGASWTCAPSAGATCAGGSGTSINDTVVIPAGGQVVYTVTGTVVAGTTGNIVNTATALPPATMLVPGAPGGDGPYPVTDPNCPPAPGAGCSATVTTPGSAIGVVKTISSVTDTNSNTLVDAGDVIHYSIVTTNTGQSTLSNVTVVDTLTAPAGPALVLTCTPTLPATLAPGASITCTANYTITQADVDHGVVDNRVVSTGTPPSGPNVTANATATQPTDTAGKISIVKSAAETDFDAVGDVIHYSFLVTNTGPVTLTNVNVTDVQAAPAGALDGPILCPVTTLAPGASTTCTATYTITQADLNNGSVFDTAISHGTPPTPPGGTTPPPVDSPPSSVTVPPILSPSIAVAKSAAEANFDAVGDVIHYSFLVTNNGNVPLSNVNVTDVQAAPAGALDGPIVCPATTLAPGASTTCTATYTITQADLTNGLVADTAISHGTPPTPPGGTTPPPVNSPPSTVTVPSVQTPTITIVKSATETNYDAVGDVIHYSFLVTNTGNVPLTNVNVTDVQAAPAGALDGPIVCPATTLAPGASTTCTATYTVTQADLTNGVVADTAVSHGTPPPTTPGGTTPPPVNSTPSTVTVPSVQTPTITIVKSAAETNYDAVGDVIHYSFLVTNTGNVPLTNVNVTDVQAAPAGALDGPIVCPATTLAPGASTTCTATYTITQADLDHGLVADTAVSHGTPPPTTPGGPTPPPVDSPPSTVSVPSVPAPAIEVVKTAAESSFASVGTVIHYSFVVTNTGNVSLTNVNVTDVQAAPAGALDGPIVCPATTLAPGASTTCTATYTVTQADLTNGEVADTAISHGTPPTPPGGTTPPPVDSPPSAVEVPAVQGPAVSLVKSAAESSYDAVGDVIHYSFLVTNTGNVPLTNVNVTDVQAAPAGALDGPIVCPATTLAPTVSTICTATYTITQADLDNGLVADTAVSHGTPPPTTPGGTTPPPVNSTPSTVIVPSVQTPTITIVKSAAETNFDAVGDVIHYSFLVKNTGNVTLTSVNVTDVQAAPAGALDGPIVCPGTTLAPGASTTCVATYTVTQADLDHGLVADTAVSHGTPPPAIPGGPTPPPVDSTPSSVSVPSVQSPAISIKKTAAEPSFASVGTVIHYSFAVKNTGNVTLTDVNVTDVQAAPAGALDGAIVCLDTTLAPDAATTCTATYTITQADLDHGLVADTAISHGTGPTPPGGTTPPPVNSTPSTVEVPAVQGPALSVVKSAAETNYDAVGDVIHYSFLLTNVGNVKLTNVNVTDVQAAPAGALDGPIVCPVTVLDPAATTTCTATYTVTQADLDNGRVTDTATGHGTPPTPPGGTTPPPVDTPPSTVVVPSVQAPSISIVKSAAETNVDAVGDVIHYSFLVTNIGNVTLSTVNVTDVQAAPAGALDGPIVCPATTLAPGESTTCTATYTVTQADLTNGLVAGHGKVSGGGQVRYPLVAI